MAPTMRYTHPGERGRWRELRSDTADRLRPKGLVNRCKGGHTGPHNRCSHPTADPPGWRRCQADHGCPIRIPQHTAHRYCRWHRDLHGEPDHRQVYADIMEAR